MATGNAGMKTPYEQGYEDGCKGYMWQQIYDQPGEEVEADDYKSGFEAGFNKYYITIGPKDGNP